MPTLESNGIFLYYESRGEGFPLVLIAGLSVDISELEGTISELAKHRRVISFDNRGAGRSDKPDIPYTIEMMADDTYGLIRGLGLGKADVLGISLGGRIAIALTLKHPEVVRMLILASTGPRVPQTRTRKLVFAMMELPRRLGAAQGKYPQPAYAYRRQLEASRDFDATPRLGEIRVSTLVLHGKSDRFAPYALARKMSVMIPEATLTTFDGGHLFVFWKQAEFLKAVESFLGSA
ncbi:MAG TPA: alpha/beta hydrolase [Nitrososphaerales archaeon]|nr:alpha/beta hydrolase [Nitrososphaerales archaeon]